MVAPRHPEHAGLSRDEAIRRGLRAIVRVRRRVYAHGPASDPPPGEFMTYVAADEAERICNEMARNERYGGERIAGGKGRGGRPWSAPRRGTATHFVCGHRRIAENTYGDGSRAKCRQCTIQKMAKWRKENPDRVKLAARLHRERSAAKYAAYRQENRLAYQLYSDIRRLAKHDGLWPERRRRNPKERSAA